MDSLVQDLVFLDFTDISDHEREKINNVLHRSGESYVELPWAPVVPPTHWNSPDVHSSTNAPYTAVPPMVGGVQSLPPPVGHSGPPWVTLPHATDDQTANNGGIVEEGSNIDPTVPVIGNATLPVASTPMVYPMIPHPQANVYVSSVNASVTFPPVPYPVYQNMAPGADNSPENTNSAPRRQRTNKSTPTKRNDSQVRRGVDSNQGNYSGQHQFSPNAHSYVPAQMSPSYQFYQTPQAVAGSPLYIQHPMQFAHPPVMISPFPSTVYTTPPPAAPHPHPPQQEPQQEVKETVPYPQQVQDHAPISPAPLTPVVTETTVEPTSPPVIVPAQVYQLDNEKETIPVTSQAVPPPSLPPLNTEIEIKQEEEEVETTPIPEEKHTLKPFPLINDTKTISSPGLVEESSPLPETPTPSQTWASRLFGSTSSESTIGFSGELKPTTFSSEPKPTAAVKPNMQHPPAVAGHSINSPATNVSSPALGNNVSHGTTPAGNNPAKSVSSNCLTDDPRMHDLGNFLVHYQLEYKPAALQPRGLTNRSNYCYINATLQALLACPPLYNLLKALPVPRNNNNNIKKKSKSCTPIIDSMVQFMNEFEELNSSGSLLKSRREKAQARKDEQSPGSGGVEIATGPPFEPTYVYKMLNVIRNDTAFPVEGRQEDAEEFLSCLLNGLNDEMLELQKLASNISNGEVTTNGEIYHETDGESEWKEVTNFRNRQTITRRTEITQTPLSQIFQGQLRSRVQRVGNESNDSIQPFFTLPLDIEKANSVKEALDQMVGKDILEGVTCTKTNQEVEAWQQVTLEQLPLVLLLHLKCFDYKLHTCSKITKTVEFPIDLRIEQKLMSTTVKSKSKKNPGSLAKDRQYKLFAVVYHDGKEATKGHYITDVYHVGYGTWVRYDDSQVRTVSESRVLHPKSPRVPYLLYYRRQDTINASQIPKTQKTDS